MASNGPETVRGKFRKLDTGDGRRKSDYSDLVFGEVPTPKNKRKR